MVFCMYIFICLLGKKSMYKQTCNSNPYCLRISSTQLCLYIVKAAIDNMLDGHGCVSAKLYLYKLEGRFGLKAMVFTPLVYRLATLKSGLYQADVGSPFTLYMYISYHCNVPFILFYFGYTHSMWKFLGQGSNPHHSSNPSHCLGNARSLTHCATGELEIFLYSWFRKDY